MGSTYWRLVQLFENVVYIFTSHTWEVCIYYFFETLLAPLPYSSPSGTLTTWMLDLCYFLPCSWDYFPGREWKFPSLLSPANTNPGEFEPRRAGGEVEFQTPFWPTESIEIEGEKEGMVLYCCMPAAEDVLSKKSSVWRLPSSRFFGQEVFLCCQWFWTGSVYNILKYMGGNRESKGLFAIFLLRC